MGEDEGIACGTMCFFLVCCVNKDVNACEKLNMLVEIVKRFMRMSLVRGCFYE